MTRFYARLALPALIGLLATPVFAQSARLDPTTGEELPGTLTAQPTDAADDAPAAFGGPPLTLLGRLADGRRAASRSSAIRCTAPTAATSSCST